MNGSSQIDQINIHEKQQLFDVMHHRQGACMMDAIACI
jgi:hypothetical protein